jgi:hypothetical protein
MRRRFRIERRRSVAHPSCVLRRLVPLVALALLAPATAARAADVIGIGDQRAAMYVHPRYQELDVKVTRLVVPWDVLKRRAEREAVDGWLFGSLVTGAQPMLAISHSRSCRIGRCPRTSVKAYLRQFRAMRKRWPMVKVWTPWNEANHFSQPTYRSPKLAAQYYNALRKACRGCTVVAADVLDQHGVATYLKTFLRYADGKPRLWGLHNYSDVNRFRTRGTKTVLRTVKGDLWLTETGGIAAFGRGFPWDLARQARATRKMFRLAKSNRRITRLYIYNWFGERRGARFDAGLVDALPPSGDGQARPSFFVVREWLKKPGQNPPPPPPGQGAGATPPPSSGGTDPGTDPGSGGSGSGGSGGGGGGGLCIPIPLIVTCP